jgi:RNA polymerase sigma factor (sigma-70 family)
VISENEDRNLVDRELIARYKEGNDLRVLADLYDTYMGLVYGVCLKYLKNREESQDAVMQIFEKLIDSLKKHEVLHFKSWLYTLTKNHCLMHLRAGKGRHFEDISAGFMETDSVLHPEYEPENEINVSKLEKCIEELSNEQKQCIQLFYMEQKCYKEITDATGYDGKKVKSFIQNGKRNLKICMERHA